MYVCVYILICMYVCVCVYMFILRTLCGFGMTGSPFVDRSTKVNILKSQLAAQLSIINYPMHTNSTTVN